MIISASRRTDIPAFYSEWLISRLQSGVVMVPNPWDRRQVGEVRLTPENVDCIVFWTKNPEPMLDKLKRIDDLGYRYYFSFTVTPYGQDMEKNLPPKDRVIETFKRLSDMIGPERVDWRFDPVVINERYTIPWHMKVFRRMCEQLRGYTERCIINFIKSYPHIASRVAELEDGVIGETARGLFEIAGECGVPLFNCTEKWDLREIGIQYSSCIDAEKIARLTRWPLKAKKDPGQPKICRCAESVDIGMYNTCPHGCAYCYAVSDLTLLHRNMENHDVDSPLQSGQPTAEQLTIDRTRPSLRDSQRRLF